MMEQKNSIKQPTMANQCYSIVGDAATDDAAELLVNLLYGKFRRATVKKDWGRELIVQNLGEPTDTGYCGKLLVFDARKAKRNNTSLHYHAIKHEAMLVLQGRIALETLGEDNVISSRELAVGDTVILPPHTPHRITSLTKFAIIAEFSTPHRDSDVFRLKTPPPQPFRLKTWWEKFVDALAVACWWVSRRGRAFKNNQ